MAFYVTPRTRGTSHIVRRGDAEDAARSMARRGYVAKVYRAASNDLVYLCRPIGGQAISCKIVEGGLSGARRRRKKRRR